MIVHSSPISSLPPSAEIDSHSALASSWAQAQAWAAEGYAYVPVVVERPADTLSPLSALLTLRREGGPCFLLESVVGGEHLGRFSFVGCNVLFEIRVEEQRAVRVDASGNRTELPGPPWQAVDVALSGATAPQAPGLPPFGGGAVGYLSFEAMHFVEPAVPYRAAEIVPICLPVFGTIAAFDHLAQRLVLVEWVPAQAEGLAARWESARSRLGRLEQALAAEPVGPWLPARPFPAPARPAFTAALGEFAYQDAVRKLKRYIRGGDIFQAVLADRFEVDLKVDPLWIYRALRSLNPSPYMFFLDLGHVTLVGASPEMLVRVNGGHAETRPIAGTRRRGATAEEDIRLQKQMLASVKERAEHVMLVDLGRNDLGRVCAGGSVHVPSFMTVERYSHVMHIVSSVQGTLARSHTPWEALGACFPAGTVSGAPKIHAMQLLAGLEPVPRGAYAGAVVYRDFRGGLDSAIAIRCLTAIPSEGGWRGYVQAGAGIVYDSVPASEWREVLGKSGAMFDAIAWAQCVSGVEPSSVIHNGAATRPEVSPSL